ncbi:MAG TPA: ABC transporter permease [Stellaceae bacterium]|nr:ABC transporter permease [Stellaceae bacterium]
MSALVANGLPRRPRLNLGRQRGLIIAVAAFALIIGVLYALTPAGFSYFDFSFMSAGGATMVLAAMGETMVILTGGFDLSAGAVISLVNVVLATHMHETGASQIGWSAAALAIGALAGAFNALFIAVMRLPAIVVTLANMFIVQGVTLLILDQPGGKTPDGLTSFFTGDAIPGALPAPVVVVAVALAIWAVIKNSRLGTGIYAVGSDEEGARASGIRIVAVKFATYVIAGAFYAAGGLFITAQTGSGDPLIGAPILLQVFAATVLGGTRLGGGRGGCLGTAFGAYTLMLTINVLLVLNVPAYYSTVAEGVILILAVLGGSFGHQSRLAEYGAMLRLRWQAWRNGTRPSALARVSRRLALDIDPAAAPRRGDELAGAAWRGWVRRHKETLRYVAPSYAFLVIVIVVTRIVFRAEMSALPYLNSVLVLSSFLAVLGLGQGAVILTGGLDLSLPWTIALCGILLTGTVEGSDQAAAWAVPMVLGVGILVGFVNGVGVAFLGLSPIVMTLAMNGILEGLALVYDNGTPHGWSAPALRWFMTGELGGVAPAVWFLIAFVAAATLLLSRTSFGRRIYAIGNSVRAARLSGVAVGTTLLGVYMLSGFCSALVGVMLTGFNGQAFNGMGDNYLLPSIAVIVVGGTVITGGRGHYLGILGGALLLTALSTALAGTVLPDAVRHIIFGAVVLGAILALREQSA